MMKGRFTLNHVCIDCQQDITTSYLRLIMKKMMERNSKFIRKVEYIIKIFTMITKNPFGKETGYRSIYKEEACRSSNLQLCRHWIIKYASCINKYNSLI